VEKVCGITFTKDFNIVKNIRLPEHNLKIQESVYLHFYYINFYKIFLPVLMISLAKGFESLKFLTSKGCGSILISIFLLNFNNNKKINNISSKTINNNINITIGIEDIFIC